MTAVKKRPFYNRAGGYRVPRWVVWWFEVGLVIGIIAFANISLHNLKDSEARWIVFICVVNWFLSGLICWGCENIQAGNAPPPQKPKQSTSVPEKREWHSASEFRLPGSGKTLLPLSSGHHHRETLAHYGLHRCEGQRSMRKSCAPTEVLSCPAEACHLDWGLSRGWPPSFMAQTIATGAEGALANRTLLVELGRGI